MGKLILLRHGESVWNKKNIFTGWVDVPLSSNGISEALKAGKQLAEIEFDVVFTSLQVRAIGTAMLVLSKSKNEKTPVIIHKQGVMKDKTKIHSETINDSIIPVHTHWQLNERHYGELQGKNKAEMAKKYGDKQVHLWRRSYDIAPPAGESLKETAIRTIPYFQNEILKELQKGKTILISAHGNSLRSIVMYIEKLTENEIKQLEIPTGKPLFYQYNNRKFTNYIKR